MDEWAFETNLFVVIQIFDSNNLLWRDYYMIRGGLEEDSKIFMQRKKHLFRPETLGELNFDSHEIVWPIEDRLQEKKTCHLAELYKQSISLSNNLPMQQKDVEATFSLIGNVPCLLVLKARLCRLDLSFWKPIYKIFQIKL